MVARLARGVQAGNGLAALVEDAGLHVNLQAAHAVVDHLSAKSVCYP